ncbi:MAG TPA: MarR family transcriptional regulator [Mycobacterium sp.]|nr:MarR family transcriptional regulator [Mycobacterium sp.]
MNLLGAAALGLSDALDEVASEAGLDRTSAAALVAMLDLARAGSVQRLSQMIGISHSGTVRLVDRLADADLVERTAGPDARTLTVRLTRRGRTVARRVRDGHRTAVDATLAGLTDPQRRQLTTICEALVANLTSARLATRRAGGVPSGGALCRMCDPVACGRPAGRCPSERTAAG